MKGIIKARPLLLITDVIYLWHIAEIQFTNPLHYTLLCCSILPVEDSSARCTFM